MFFVYFPKGNCRFTFAWFQATSTVQISASSSSTTISVSKPDDVEVGDPTLYAYNANFTEDGGVYDNHGYNAAVDPNKVSMLFEREAVGSGYFTITDNKAGYSSSNACTKVFTGHKISIVPEADFEIDDIVLTTVSGKSHAKHLAEMTTWENATATQGKGATVDNVYLDVTDGHKIVSVLLSEPIWLIDVVINYKASGSTEWDLSEASCSFMGGDPRESATSKDYSSMTWVTAEDPANVTNSTYFTQLTNANKAALLNSSKLAPGYKLSYAAKLVVSAGSPTNASFYLKKYTSTQLLNRYILTSPSSSSGNPIRVEETMKVCTSINTTGWFFGSNVNQFDYNSAIAADTTTLDTAGGNVQTKVFNSEAAESAYSPDELGTFENFTGTTVYFFFTIEFSDETGTNYQEYTAVSGSVTGKPGSDYVVATTYSGGTKYYTKSGRGYAYDSGNQPSNQSDIDTGNYFIPNARYFYQDSPGETSNCYAGLTFQINKIELTLS